MSGLVHSSAEDGASIPTELVARLEVAPAGSRELDFWIAYDLGLLVDVVSGRPSRVEIGDRELAVWDSRGRRAGWIGFHVSKPVTTSLDAALALAERVLPGQARAIGDMAFDPPGKPWATIWTKGGDPKFNVQAATPALALCIAILKATTASAVGTSAERE